MVRPTIPCSCQLACDQATWPADKRELTPSSPLPPAPVVVKFVLLHEAKNDEGIRLFFLDVWEAYVKVRRRHLVCIKYPSDASDSRSDHQVLLNPFHTPNTPIKGPLFDGKVRASARKHL